jgi:hypothetical protein
VIHYHGTPINPRPVVYELAGRNFCVSFTDPRQVEICHQIGQSVMLDNGAYSLWKLNPLARTYMWDAFYAWARPWLDFHTTWAVIPDVIMGDEAENDALIAHSIRMLERTGGLAPVWHLHESFERLEHLVNNWDRVCFGSSAQYAQVGSDAWSNRVNEAFNRICKGSGRPPAWIHMLRGMSLAGSQYPFASVDSTDIARNHNRPQNNAREMADRWDAQQCPAVWMPQPVQQVLS